MPLTYALLESLIPSSRNRIKTSRHILAYCSSPRHCLSRRGLFACLCAAMQDGGSRCAEAAGLLRSFLSAISFGLSAPKVVAPTTEGKRNRHGQTKPGLARTDETRRMFWPSNEKKVYSRRPPATRSLRLPLVPPSSDDWSSCRTFRNPAGWRRWCGEPSLAIVCLALLSFCCLGLSIRQRLCRTSCVSPVHE